MFLSPQYALAKIEDNSFKCKYDPTKDLCIANPNGKTCADGYSIDPNKCLPLSQENCVSVQTCVLGAQPTYNPTYYQDKLIGKDVPVVAAKISDLETVIGNVISYVLGFAGIVLFILLLIGGFRYITSGGDPKAVEEAKKTLTSAIAGLIIILLAYVIMVLITNLTGVDVTNFKIVLP